MDQENEWKEICTKLQIGKLTRHIFLCTGPKCVSNEEGMKAWDHLKTKLKDENLKTVYRTKVGCLRVCKNGPIGLIYPEGTWYHSLSPENLDRVLEEDIKRNHEVRDLKFAQDALDSF
jgi:(2Fe-2S) ferredoxin